MTPDPDALLQQLTQAGLYPQQLAQLQRQYQLAQGFMQPQEAQGRQVGGTYVASSPLEHLSSALRPVIGAYMQRQAMNREGELTGQLSSGRQAFARALQDSSGHPGELMPGGAGDQQRQQQLYGLGALSGDPAMENAAKYYQQQSVLQNTMRHQQTLEDLERQKVNQSNFEVIKDMYGNATGAIDKRTGRMLPLSVRGGGQGGQAGLTQQAKDMLAQQGLTSGQLPRLPGRAGAAMSMDVANRMAQMGGENTPDLAGNKAGYGADTNSLKKLQGQADAIDAFEKTALQNLDQFLNTAHSVVDTGSPLFNAPARRFMQSVAGDPKMAQFNAARQVAVQEISKVLGGSLGGVVSDSARHEASGLLTPDASLAQIEAAAQILKQDMHNRKTAMQEQITAVRSRAGGHGGGTPPTAPPPAGPGPSAPSGRPRRTVNGETREWDGNKWVPVNG
jgi:hypothetical protein